MHFSLACGRKRAFLDSKATFLKFKLTNNSASCGATLVIDGSVHSAIQLFELYYGSTQLEYIWEYAPLVSVLMDSQASTDRVIRNGNILEGLGFACG